MARYSGGVATVMYKNIRNSRLKNLSPWVVSTVTCYDIFFQSLSWFLADCIRESIGNIAMACLHSNVVNNVVQQCSTPYLTRTAVQPVNTALTRKLAEDAVLVKHSTLA